MSSLKFKNSLLLFGFTYIGRMPYVYCMFFFLLKNVNITYLYNCYINVNSYLDNFCFMFASLFCFRQKAASIRSLPLMIASEPTTI